MWKKTVRCELEEEGGGGQGKWQPTGNGDGWHRLRSCRVLGMGAGTGLAQRGQAPLKLKLELAPTSLFYNPTSQRPSRNPPSANPEFEGLSLHLAGLPTA